MKVAPASQHRNPLSARERVELNLSQLDRLPTLPAVAARLLAVTTSDNTSARDVVELIESDAALTACVLRFARRADLGVRAEAITIPRVVTLLGFNAVRNLVLCVQLYEAFAKPDENDRAAETRKGLWLHTFAVACTAQMIGERVGDSELGGLAFVCGLLHDVGKIALDACMPKGYARVVDRVTKEHACICDVEREVFGLDHTIAGKHLASRWDLPEAVVECAWLHHQSADALPTTVRSSRLVQIVHLADHLIRQQGIGFSGYQHVADTDKLSTELGLEADNVTDILNRLPEVMGPLSELVGLDDLGSRVEYTRSLIAANKQLGQLNVKLSEAVRRLEIRAVCFAALEQFVGALSDQDRVSDVCVTAARTIRNMLEAEGVLCFFAETSSRCVHVGYLTATTEDGIATIVDLGELGDELPLPLGSAGALSHGFSEAPTSLLDLWHRCVGSPSPQPLWMLPVLAGPDTSGAVLVAGEKEAVRRTHSAPKECETLSTAMALALTSARARVNTERMTEELLEVNRRLQAAQRELVKTRSMSMIAEMAAGAAHELNNPLAVVSGRAQMALTACTDEETARTFRIIKEQTQRATDIVDELMRFAKPHSPQPAEQPLVELLEPCCQHWRQRAELKGDALSVTMADPAATVYADPAQVRRILDAIISNAVEATRGMTARVVINSPSHASDETVRIVVEDNGVGMTREVLEHATDPFFSSRKAGRGRGLGLSLAYRLTEINNGQLRIRSTPNVGTTVTIELPARVSRS
jgi:putative nucleotidyltransferase with HDIG domain